MVPEGTGLDPGGLGKGLASDIVVEELLERGIDGALVSTGGDLRCAGIGPGRGSWVIEVGDDAAGVPFERLELAGGGVATSTSRRRRWRTRSGEAHHLIDPVSGGSASRPADLVTVIAATSADAEWVATALAVRGELPLDTAWLGGAAVMLTDIDGHCTSWGPIEEFIR